MKFPILVPTLRSHLLLALLLIVPAARGETINCTPIDLLPYSIVQQGVYCLTANLETNMTSGSAIEILANNVTIDMNGYKLGGLGAGRDTSAIGIRAFQRKNITIRNGIVRGFLRGIHIQDTGSYVISQGHLVEDILADRNTSTGLAVDGRGNTIRGNQVVETGGSTVESDAIGIVLRGSDGKILNNDVTTTRASVDTNGNGRGILLENAEGSVIDNNRVSDVQGEGLGAGYGVHSESSSTLTLRDNILKIADRGISLAIVQFGVFPGVCKGNIVQAAPVHFVNCLLI